MESATIEAVRRFNRTVGESIGLAGGRFLGRPRSPGESRLLWEIGSDGIEIRRLRQRLALDSGYVSRVIQSLVHQRLVRVRAGGDRRVRRVELTAKGLKERAYLDRRSDDLVRHIFRPLSSGQQRRLAAAMLEVERLLLAAMVRFRPEDPKSPDAAWCLGEYFAELAERFDAGFDPARSISADARELTRPHGVFVIARLRDRAIGCGALKFHGREPAELKRMWLAKDVRGLGVGARLLAALEREAREAGASLVRLETNRALTEAIALYHRCGYREVAAFNNEPYAHHWFEKRL